ncbi:hypothetical protein HNR16_002326 [Pseudoclavibacter chungangensis]|uniref:plasmid pRiA4b ORF-3 family protein n=1 Tax=Pseudoclavibacter chungangensis TaxID=587635 RepID=UPI0017FDFEAC|nr:plasmid pRiA4b ORF-3 family protein [Pseudoclavibacter chungangensis]NYJ67538.1 hypothetical protein [Pseudoclavibacter chungangensis]
MTPHEFEAPDLQKLIEHAFPELSPEQRAALFVGGLAPTGLPTRPEPRLLPVPTTVRGFRVRLDLSRTKPPVWRRLEIAGDTTLPQLHEVIQAAMGWTDSHLHRFRTGHDPYAPEFLTGFDLDEGDEGMPEDGVRLDQLVADEGDRLWYDYDFGDNWQHVLRVERVLDTPPPSPTCIGGRLACPPEDCGGTWGYDELAAWVRSDYDDTLRPDVFDSVDEGRAWLPEGWHPDAFDAEETNAWLAAASAEPGPVGEELASLLELSRDRGSRALRDTLAHPAADGPTDIDDDSAAELTEPFRVLLEAIGNGTDLTAAGYLKPAVVEQIAQHAGIAEWWIGKANREDLTTPVANLRALARALGLVVVRHGRITPARTIARHGHDPQALLRHIAGRLPLGTSPADRHAGWAALAVAACATPSEQWPDRIAEILFDLGWRDRDAPGALPPSGSPTLGTLMLLSGDARSGRRLHGVNEAVAALARRIIRGRRVGEARVGDSRET